MILTESFLIYSKHFSQPPVASILHLPVSPALNSDTCSPVANVTLVSAERWPLPAWLVAL